MEVCYFRISETAYAVYQTISPSGHPLHSYKNIQCVIGLYGSKTAFKADERKLALSVNYYMPPR